MHINNKIVSSKNLNKDTSILVISDIALTKHNESKNIQKLLNCNLTADYLCLVGDLINNSEHLNDSDFVRYLVSFINSLKILSDTTVFSFGNHDSMYGSAKSGWKEDSVKKLRDILKKYTDIILLDNSKYSDTSLGITFYGLTNSFDFYNNWVENPALYDYELNCLIEKFKKELESKDSCSILMSHAGNGILKSSLMSYFDLILSGHYHNGCVPPILNALPGHTGLIGPQSDILPNNVRGVITRANSTLIINGPINPFNEMQALNNIYGPSASKVLVKRK